MNAQGYRRRKYRLALVKTIENNEWDGRMDEGHRETNKWEAHDRPKILCPSTVYFRQKLEKEKALF